MVKKLSGVANNDSPLLKKREIERALVVVMTADKGLCGGLNSNLIKKAEGFIASKLETGVEVDVVQWGKRGSVVPKRLGLNVSEVREKVLEKPDYSNIELLQPKTFLLSL